MQAELLSVENCNIWSAEALFVVEGKTNSIAKVRWAGSTSSKNSGMYVSLRPGPWEVQTTSSLLVNAKGKAHKENPKAKIPMAPDRGRVAS